MTQSETIVRLDVYQDQCQRALSVASFPPPLLSGAFHQFSMVVDLYCRYLVGKWGSMIERPLLGFKYYSGWNLYRDFYYLFMIFFM